MKNIFNASKCGIAALLTLCVLLGLAGTCLNVTAMASETTATVEETAVATEEITTVVDGDTTVVAKETTSELIPTMAQWCWNDDYSDYSDYDGLTFKNTNKGLDALGISYGGSGRGVRLLDPNLVIKFGQMGTDLCVFISEKTTGEQLSWFKVKQW